ncbi:serine protease [Actinoplanes sp. ATCC 53533]|uniref:S1C family serine protease n=1 Tax=Actinoplanes sp. ATCC 53533 TaxID=1288362 RepID=UPI000F77E105|nr:trypsin-like peptidase domain-containing protein [Actinoplanes sp. ATCC 53533]RSM69423.1 serine protease [Actinoplanes sp. ATCC 53533]
MRWTAAGAVAVTLVVLALVAAGQDRRIEQLRREAAEARRAAETARAATDQRLTGLNQQVTGLETRLAALNERSLQAFDSRAVAASALPSVFLVVAGDFTGSAFAIGKPQRGRTRILTAYHVVESVWTAGRTTVQLERDGKSYRAAITDVSSTHDLALLTVNAKINGIAAARAKPTSGEQILVVGAPLGLADTITTGVVSAVRARVGGPGTMIQIDAPVNPGNSGGPVINSRKEVVGIADAKAQNAEGIGLAVPIQTACKVFDIC